MKDPNYRFCVYLHIRPDTMQVFYVGIGIRSKRAYSKQGRNNHWNRIVTKNNGQFIVEVLCDNQCRSSVCQIEVALIKFYGRVDKGTGVLCNQTDGGDGSYNSYERTFDEETGNLVFNIRRIKTYRHTDEHKKWISERLIGRFVSEETRKKQSVLAKGRICSDATREKRRIYGLAQIQSEESKLKRSMTLKGRTLDRGAVANSALAKIINRGWTVEKVCVETGKILDNYLKISDAAEAHGLSISTVSACIKQYRGQTTAGGYHWRQNHDKDMMDKLVQSYSLT